MGSVVVPEASAQHGLDLKRMDVRGDVMKYCSVHELYEPPWLSIGLSLGLSLDLSPVFSPSNSFASFLKNDMIAMRGDCVLYGSNWTRMGKIMPS